MLSALRQSRTRFYQLQGESEADEQAEQLVCPVCNGVSRFRLPLVWRGVGR